MRKTLQLAKGVNVMARNEKPKKAKTEKGLADLFEHALKDMYYAEKKVLKALPKMVQAAMDQELKDTLSAHREETAAQIEQLEQIFEMIGKKAKGQPCDAINGILEESEGILEDFAGTSVVDAAIIFSCQAVEHYEITRYGSMAAWAKALGMAEADAILVRILAQEMDADNKLSSLGERRINHAAG
jgi:ferritin-like metal-binding protein YciE